MEAGLEAKGSPWQKVPRLPPGAQWGVRGLWQGPEARQLPGACTSERVQGGGKYPSSHHVLVLARRPRVSALLGCFGSRGFCGSKTM